MLTCRDVSRLLSESMDHPLSLPRRMALRVHMMMCKMCSRYEGQLRLIRSTMGEYSDPDSRARRDDIRLSEEKKEEIQKLIRDD